MVVPRLVILYEAFFLLAVVVLELCERRTELLSVLGLATVRVVRRVGGHVDLAGALLLREWDLVDWRGFRLVGVLLGWNDGEKSTNASGDYHHPSPLNNSAAGGIVLVIFENSHHLKRHLLGKVPATKRK